MDAVVNFFRGGELPIGVKCTVISLIPKTDNPKNWTEFRPISLCTVFNKVLSKIQYKASRVTQSHFTRTGWFCQTAAYTRQ